MISLWPFGTQGGRIKDLKSHQMAEAAIKSLQNYGRAPISLRLLFRALELDPHNPRALLILSELYRGRQKVGRPTGDEIYAGILIEYAMDPKTALPKDQRPVFEKARISVMSSWGFSSERGTETDLDHIGYMTYINELMGQVRSVANGFKIAFVKLGIQAGALEPTRGKHTETYDEWLKSNASTINF